MLKARMPSRSVFFFLVVFLLVGVLCFGRQCLAQGKVLVIDLEGAINPASAMVLERGLEKAQKLNAAVVVVRLDTPGGLASSMRTMVKSIMNSPIPVV
ncbi:MAG: nodulation protein NfeD, partial [Deltaproteobacteria bacterium]